VDVAPHRVGTLVDMMATSIDDDFRDGLRMAFDDALDLGLLDRPVEVVHRQEEGLPRRPVKVVQDGWKKLALDEGCLAIIGPWVTENTLAVRPLAEEHHVPTIAWSGTNLFPGEYCFNLGNGSIPDEATLLANYLFRKGARRVAVIRERNQNGEEYRSYFQQAAERYGIDIVADLRIHQTDEGLREALERMRAMTADAIAYFGFGFPLFHMGPVLKAMGWDPPRVCPGTYMFIYSAGFSEPLEGWVGVDQLCEDNPRLAPFLARYGERFGRHALNLIPALAYDTGMLVANGIANAPVRTPEGVKQGLERVRMMPTIAGGPRTHVSFGPYDRKGWKGDYLVLRQLRNGKNEFLGYYEPYDRLHSADPADSTVTR
jgi:ABC-type branched-subunit amino acid transport system substrate-binding protein